MADYDTSPFSASSRQPARLALRSRTRVDHDIVDNALSRFDLGSREDYGRFLGAQWLAYREVEGWLASNSDTLPRALVLPERSALLVKDLADLGIALPEPGIPEPMPTTLSAASLIGVSYCVAGSSFGARTLLRRLPENFPRRFLSEPLPDGYWHTLIGEIEALQIAGKLAAAVAGAKHTFRLFAAAAERMAGPAAEHRA